MEQVHVLVAEIHGPCRILLDAPVEGHDARVCGIGLVLVVLEEKSSAAEGCLKILTSTEDGAVVDGNLECLVVCIIETGWCRFRQEKNG